MPLKLYRDSTGQLKVLYQHEDFNLSEVSDELADGAIVDM